jgi:phage regulator Rha-like protein
MGENFIIPDETIISKIHQLRSTSIMLDRDLAILFDVKTFRLREQVKRNKMRFPENFMFQLTENEVDVMVSQNAIPSKQYLGGHLPFVFTEHGVLQLSNVLKSERANQISIKIIELFVKMREMLLTHKDILLQLEEMRKSIKNNDERVDMIYNYLVQFINEQKKPRNEIGFKSNFQH